MTGAMLPATALIGVSGRVRLDATLVLDLNSVFDAEVEIEDAVFFELDDLSVDLTLSVIDIDLGLETLFLEASLAGGVASVCGSVTLTLDDPDKRMSLAEFSGKGFSELFDFTADDIVMKLGVLSLEIFAGVGRDVGAGRDGTGLEGSKLISSKSRTPEAPTCGAILLPTPR